MKFKRLLCLGMAAALACSSLPQTVVFAEGTPSEAVGEETEETEETGVKLEYEMLEDGTCEVRANPEEAYGELVIPAQLEGIQVSQISERGFQGCDTLTKVTLPEGIVGIGSFAFSNCKNLKEIVLPEGLASIGANAFDECSSLTGVAFPSTLKSIMDSAFSGCGLAEVILPEGLEEIVGNPFPYNQNLQKIQISEEMQHMPLQEKAHFMRRIWQG